MHADCSGVAVSCFKQILHLPVVVDQRHDIVNISEVRHMDVGTNVSPWKIVQGLTKNIVDNVVEESWR